MFASVAHAMGTAGAGQAGGADALMQFVPLIAMLAIFYFLLIRPQQKRAKQHKAMLEALKKGDQVLTTGGLVGRVVDIDGDKVTLRGDGNLNTEQCSLADIRGIATAFYRKGRSTPDYTSGRKWRIYSAIWTRLLPIRRYLLFIYRKVKK